MSSLIYSGEHLAWKQRISKEGGAHYKQYPQELRGGIMNQTGPKRRIKRRSLSPISDAVSPLRATNPYAEVRGKYVACAKLPEYNKVISRPSTQGSLIKDHPRSYQKPKALIAPVKKEEAKSKSRPLSKEETQTPHKVEAPPAPSYTLPKPIITVPEVLEEDEDQEDPLELLDDVEPLPEDIGSEYSFKTTSSKLKYIEELEELLRQERTVSFM